MRHPPFQGCQECLRGPEHLMSGRPAGQPSRLNTQFSKHFTMSRSSVTSQPFEVFIGKMTKKWRKKTIFRDKNPQETPMSRSMSRSTKGRFFTLKIDVFAFLFKMTKLYSPLSAESVVFQRLDAATGVKNAASGSHFDTDRRGSQIIIFYSIYITNRRNYTIRVQSFFMLTIEKGKMKNNKRKSKNMASWPEITKVPSLSQGERLNVQSQ